MNTYNMTWRGRHWTKSRVPNSDLNPQKIHNVCRHSSRQSNQTPTADGPWISQLHTNTGSSNSEAAGPVDGYSLKSYGRRDWSRTSPTECPHECCLPPTTGLKIVEKNWQEYVPPGNPLLPIHRPLLTRCNRTHGDRHPYWPRVIFDKHSCHEMGPNWFQGRARLYQPVS